MNEKVFLELLSKGKLFSIDNFVLRLHHEFDNDTSPCDTFFKCISTALMGTHTFNVQIRAACMLRFITLLFYIPNECINVSTFLEEYADDASVKGLAYQDKAIQMWLIRHTHLSHLNTKIVFEQYKREVKECALEFIMQNNQIGHLSCRFTFCYLLSGLYNTVTHFYDQIEPSGNIHIQPLICQPSKHKGDIPEDTDEEIAQKQLHIYIWNSCGVYKLLVPIIRRPTTRGQFWLHNQMKTCNYTYQLRQSHAGVHNLPVGDFELIKSVYVCDISQTTISESSIYMIFPAGSTFKFHMEPGQHMFVFCVREADTDHKPYLECIVELMHDITYPYFMLKKDIKRVAVLVIDKQKSEAIEIAKQELNVA